MCVWSMSRDDPFAVPTTLRPYKEYLPPIKAETFVLGTQPLGNIVVEVQLFFLTSKEFYEGTFSPCFSPQ